MNYAEYKQNYKSNANVVSSGTSDINNTMSYAEYQRTYKADTASAAISKFNSDYESYINDAKSIGTTWRSDDDMKQLVADMSAKNTSLYSQLHRIRNFIDDDTYKSLSEALDVDFTDAYLSAKEYNRQFVNETAYNAEKQRASRERTYLEKYGSYDYSALKRAVKSNPYDAGWLKERMKAIGTTEQLTADKNLFVSEYVPLTDEEKAAYQKDTTLLSNGRYGAKGYADMVQKAKVVQAAQTALKQDEEKAAKYEKENAAFETLLKQKKAASSAEVSDEDLKKALDDAKSKINNAKSEKERNDALTEKDEAEQAYNQRVNENAYQSEYAHLSLEEIAKKVDELNQKIAYAYENSTSATRDGYLGFLKQKENGVYSEEKLNKILNNGGLSALYVEAARAGYDDFYSYVEQQLDSEFNNAKYAYNRKLTEEYAFDHLDQLKAQIEVAEGDTKKELQQQYDELYHTVYGEKDWANYIVSNVGSGLSQWGSDMASGLDFILSLPNKISGGNLYMNNSPTQLLKESAANNYQNAQEKAAAATQAMGESGGWKIGANVISGVSAAIPDLVIAYLTAGSGTAASAAGKAASAGSKASKIFSTVKTAVKTTAKNPQFWTSFVREVGTTYDTALSSGATSNQATTTAIISSLINAYIEVGGGIETLPDALKNTDKSGVRVWVEQMFDEGKEEVLQGIVSNLTQKVVYDHDKELISATDDDAVISLTRAANEFMMGAVVGGILSAAPTAARGIASSYDQRVLEREGRTIIKNMQSDELYSIALQMPEGSVSRTYAEQNSEVLKSNTNKKTAAKTAQLRKYVVNDFLEQINVTRTETIDAIEKRYIALAGKTKATAETRKDAELIYKAYEGVEMTSQENSRLLTVKNYGQILKELYSAAENNITPENEWTAELAIADVEEKYSQLEKVIDMVRIAKGEEVSQTESSAENTTQKTQPIEPVDMTPNVVPPADTVDASPFTEPDLNEGDFHQQMLAEADGKPVSIQARNEVTSIAKKLGFKVIWKADINSNGYIKGNTIVLNSRQTKPVLTIMVHEFVHSLEKSGKYQEFLNYVWNSKLFEKWVNEKTHGNLTKDELWARYQTEYKKLYGKDDIAIKTRKEMLCDFVADKLFRKDIDKGEIDPALLEAVKNHTFVDTILSWLKRMIEVFKKHPVQAELIKMQNDIQKLYKQAQKQGFENGEKYSLDIDNKNDKRYNINNETNRKAESNVRTNEFRELQEASRRLSNKDVEAFHNGSKTVDDGIRRQLSMVFRREISNTNGLLWNGNTSVVNAKTNKKFDIIKNVDAKLFYDIFEIVQKHLRSGDAVDLHSVQDYKNTKNYLSEDGLSGFSITKEGDLISVFSLSKGGGFLQAIREFVKQEGAKTLDCFNSDLQNLPLIYSKTLGFKTASVLDFNCDMLVEDKGQEYADYFVETYGKAPVAFMVNTDADVQTKHFNKDQYDEALEYRNSFIETGLDNDEEYQNMLVESSKSKDTDYLKAVEDGDMETAQKMVDEAAKKAGYSVKAYHGTPIKNITSFDSEKIGSNTDSGIFGRGFYFSTDEKTANVYATQDGQTMPVYLRYNNPWWAVAHRDVSKVAEELNMDARALTMRGYGGKGKIVAPSNLQEAQFSSHLQEKGYDSVVVQHGKNNYEIVVFNPTNIKSADPVTYDDDGNVIPLSKRFKENQDDIRYSLDVKLDDETFDGEVYGTIPPGEKPARVVRVPKKVDGTYTNRFVRTIMEHGDVSELQVELLKDGVLHETENFRHEVVKDKSAIEYAQNRVKDGSAEDEFRDFADGIIKKFEPGYMKKGMAIGSELLLSYAKSGEIKKFLDCATDMSQLATEAGRMTQASRLLKQMTGAGRLYVIQRQVDKINKDLENNFHKKAPVVQIDEQLAKMLCDTTSKDDADLIEKMIMQKVAEQVPATPMQKWNAWRYLSMLFNPRTHIRNVVGNLVFMPAVRVKDTLGAAMEKFIPEDERTKVLKVGKNYREFAEKDLNSAEVSSKLQGDNRKYDDGINLAQNQRIFKSQFLEKTRNFNFDMLEKPDMYFLKRHYIHALGSALQARGIDLDTISTEQLESAREYAIKEAMKATYRDASNFATALRKLGANNKVAGFFIEAVFPFKKTPVNIAKRAIEYSPIGLVRSIVKQGVDYGKYRYNAKKFSKPSASEFIDNLCAGLTGTGIMLVGMFLGSLGLVKALPDEDDEEFEKLIGSQNYSVEMFGYSYTLDWAAPACIPFFMGVSLANKSEGETSNWFDMFASLTMDALSPMLEMSFVDGLNDLLSSVKYGTDGNVGDVLSVAWSAISSYFMQAVPTIFGQAARIIDPKSRNAYYTDKNSAMPEFAQELIHQVMAKTPGLSMLLPAKVDKWGNEIETPLVEDILENTVSPGYLSKVEADNVDKELQRVYKSVGGTNIDGTIFPKTADKYYEVGEEKYYLSADEYHDYQQLFGQSSKQYLSELMSTNYYSSLSDEQKVDKIKKMYSYAKAKAKRDLFGVSSKTYEKAFAFEDAGFSIPEYYAAMDILSKDNESADTNGDGTYSKSEKYVAIMNSDLSDKDFYYAWEYWQGKKRFTQLETIEEKIKFVKSTI